MTIIEVALPLKLHRSFEYKSQQLLDNKENLLGRRVWVPFQSRKLVGVITGLKKSSEIPEGKLKSIISIIDNESIFQSDIYALCEWAAAYYHSPLGEVLNTALPALLRAGKPIPETKALTPNPVKESHLALNSNQKQMLSVIVNGLSHFSVFLLNGVTGSGKTEVYLQAIDKVLALNKQVLVMIPEISLTPQTISRFSKRFSVPIVSLHSNLSPKARLDAWTLSKNNEAKIIIGTRSAIFTAIPNLGLIVIDEEHDPSFKQQDRLRYHGRDLAIIRAKMLNIPIVLGSATPSLESYHNGLRNRYQLLNLPNRAGKASFPDYKLIDIKKDPIESGLSLTLRNLINSHLAENQQVLLYLNRRGFSPVYYCLNCGFIEHCDQCDSKLVYHQYPKRLHCHLCDYKTTVPTQCKQCKVSDLAPIGLGTQRLEEALKKYFPQTPIIRIDRDTTKRKGEVENLLIKANSGESAILLGTQMLAKGHHFPNTTLVGIIDADCGLFSADFKAPEQLGQLLVQVAGRAGRGEIKGVVAVQTRHPDHAWFNLLLNNGYSAFAKALIEDRKIAKLPPFHYCALLKAEARDPKYIGTFLIHIKQHVFQDNVMVLGPMTSVYTKKKGYYAQQLLFKSLDRHVLKLFLNELVIYLQKPIQIIKRVKWVLDVDPVEF